jgi:hypothetical protein
VIINARITSFTGKTKGGKDEEPIKVGRLILETEDLDDWQLEFLGALLDGQEHEVAIDEHVRATRKVQQ